MNRRIVGPVQINRFFRMNIKSYSNPGSTEVQETTSMHWGIQIIELLKAFFCEFLCHLRLHVSFGRLLSNLILKMIAALYSTFKYTIERIQQVSIAPGCQSKHGSWHFVKKLFIFIGHTHAQWGELACIDDAQL